MEIEKPGERRTASLTKSGMSSTTGHASQSGHVSHKWRRCNTVISPSARLNNAWRNGNFSLGICAMTCKVESRPMQSILKRLQKAYDFQIVQFSEQMILETDITEWPKVDCLIAFHSWGYPLEKVQAYVKLVQPVTLNDVFSMKYLRSRIDVFRALQQSGIPTPSHMIVNHMKCRDEGLPFEEHYDYIQYNGLRLNKPFIEKPADADNHNNYVYYPRNTGGGCKKLFRKVEDRSSEFYPDIHQVRRDGTYVYEEFLSTFGTDVKVYTVGQMFAHAEARKSPTLDGKVQRSPNGKEVRYPVILTEVEKLAAYKIVEAFKQTVCGFDILRTTNGVSVVCDVNGWSFVKGNVKYYNDCAHIIRMLFLKRLQDKFNFIPRELPEGWCNNIEEEDTLLRKTFVNVDDELESSGHQDEELRSVVVVMRHGDRKPKQKLKFEISEPEILDYHTQSYWGRRFKSVVNPKTEIKLKSPEELRELLQKTRAMLARLEQIETLVQDMRFLDNVRMLQGILERGDGFTGINRKFQIKPIAWDEMELAGGERQPRVTRQLVVAKWGGELTRVGRAQAEDLGKRLRVALYPGDEGGLLRLHSTFRHDLKIYTSDEGRCQVTSAAFTKGFLDLEGDLTPILVQMVIRNAKAHALLDFSQTHIEARDRCKSLLDFKLNQNGDLYQDVKAGLVIWREDRLSSGSLKALQEIGNSRQKMQEIQRLIEEFLEALNIQIERFDTAILEQSRQGTMETFSTEQRNDLPGDKRTADSWASCAGSSCHTTTACLGSHTAITEMQEEDSNILKDGEGSADFDEASPIIETYLKSGNLIQRNPNERDCRSQSSSEHGERTPPEMEKGTQTSTEHSRQTSRRDSEFLLKEEVAACSSCRLVVLLCKRLKEIRYRWLQIHDGWFDSNNNKFDSSKIPDVVDNVRFDLIHHHTHIGTQALHIAFEIYNNVVPLSNFVSPAEYGITPEEKAEIGSRSISRLIRKILKDVTFFRQASDQPLTSATSSSNNRPVTATTQQETSTTADAVGYSHGIQGRPDGTSVTGETCDNAPYVASAASVNNPVSESRSRTPTPLPTGRGSNSQASAAPSLGRIPGSASSIRRSDPVSSEFADDANNSLPFLFPSTPRLTSTASLQLTGSYDRPITPRLDASVSNLSPSPVPSRKNSGVALIHSNTAAGDAPSPVSSPSYKKRHTQPTAAGGETYWLVPHEGVEPTTSLESRPDLLLSRSLETVTSSTTRELLPSSVSAQPVACQHVGNLTGTTGTTTDNHLTKDTSANKGEGSHESLSEKSCGTPKMAKPDKSPQHNPATTDSTVAGAFGSSSQSTTVVINSDHLWAHQKKPAKDNSSLASAKDGSKPSGGGTNLERKIRLGTQNSEASLALPTPDSNSSGLPSPLQFPSMPRNGHEMSDLQLSSDVSQVSMKKPLVVSYTDQNFEPKGGIYVGYSRDTAPGRRKPDEKVEKAVSNKPANSPLLNTATGLLGVGNKSVKRGSFSSATSSSKQSGSDSITTTRSPEPTNLLETSYSNIIQQTSGDRGPASSITDDPDGLTDNTEDFVGEGWSSGDDDEIVKQDTGENGVDGQENEDADDQQANDEDDDDDDKLSHFRLKEEEAIHMGIKSPWRIVRSRYYVASASHIMSLYNILLHGGPVLNEKSHELSFPPVKQSVPSSGQIVSPNVASSRAVTPSPLSSTPIPSVPSASSIPFLRLSSLHKTASAIPSTISLVSASSQQPQQQQPQQQQLDYPLGKAPTLVDSDAEKDADLVTDVHYLSHIVFRVWEKKTLGVSDPHRFRVEIQFSSGAKDGFGSNCALLREHTQAQQSVFQQHLEHLLSHHIASISGQQNQLYKKEMRTINCASIMTPGAPLDVACPGLRSGSLHLTLSDNPPTATDQCDGKQTDIKDKMSEPATNPISMVGSTSKAPPSSSNSHEEGVPPYCEIHPLLRLTKSCTIASLETVFQSLLKHFGPSQVSSSSAASTIAASTVSVSNRCLD